MSDNQTYFASHVEEDEKEELGSRIMEKVENFYEGIKGSGFFHRARKSYSLYFGATVNNTGSVSWQITKGGKQGELLHSFENHYRSIGSQLKNLITSQRPAVQATPKNSDYKSLSQVLVANSVLESMLTDKGVEHNLKDCTEVGIYQAEGYVFAPWDTEAGEDYLPQGELPGEPELDEYGEEIPQEPMRTMKTGDTKFYVLGPMDVIRDDTAPSWDEINWVIVRVYKNKYELAEKYPEKKEDILGVGEKEIKRHSSFFAQKKQAESDLVPEYQLFHKPCGIPGLENGLHVKLLNSDIILFSGPNPYTKHKNSMPLYRFAPRKVHGTTFGSTPLWDLMGPQDAINALDGAIITNELGRGIGNLLVHRQSGVNKRRMSESMNLISWEGQFKPEPLAWPATPAELFKYKAEKIAMMETLSGINSVVRGNPSQNVGADASGAKLALIQAQALQANTDSEKEYADLVRDVSMGYLHNLQVFGGDAERVIKLVGKNKQVYFKSFVSSDISDIDNIVVDVGAPIMRTTSGRMTVADKAIELGAIKPGEFDKYIMLMQTGDLEQLLEGKVNSEMRIKMENEQMMDGQPARALISDPHWKEIPAHLALLESPAMRENTPEAQMVQQLVMEHIQEHIQFFVSMNPVLLITQGGPEVFAMWQQIQQLLMQQQQQMMAAQGMPPPGMGAPMGPPAQGTNDAMNSMAPPDPGMPGMPGMPTNPATGEEAPGVIPPPAPPVA